MPFTRKRLKISDEDVEKRAYRIFLDGDGQFDSQIADWFKAEDALLRENIKKKENITCKVIVCQMN